MVTHVFRQSPPRAVIIRPRPTIHVPIRRNKRNRYTGRVNSALSQAKERLPLQRWQRVVQRPGVRHAAVLALFFALAIVWLRPLPWQMGDHVTGPGDPLTTAWRIVWPAQWLMHRDAPFWETNILYPASKVFARDELTLGESLIAGPIYAATRNALLAYNATLLLTMTLCGFFMYCLAWHFLRSSVGGVIAGVIFALSPYHLAQLDHVGLLSVQWLPLELLFLDRAFRHRRWRDAMLFAATVFLQAISAGYYAYWSAIIVAVYTGYVLATKRHLLSLVAIRRIAIGLAVAFAALVPVVSPFMHVADREAFARPLREVEYWSARPQTWLAATPNSLLYGRLVRVHAWTWSTEMYLFPGGIALLLAVIGLAMRRKDHLRWFALALAGCGFVLTLGPTLHLARRDVGHLPLPYALLYRFVPGGDALRAPVRAAPIAMLGVALLAAFGWQHLAAWIRVRTTRRAVASATAIIVGLALCVEYAIAPLHTVSVPQLDANQSSLVGWLRQEPPGIVAVLPDLRAPVTMALATTNRHRFINGDAEILSPASRALFAKLSDFPSPASVAALDALGVNLVVLTRASYNDAAWEEMTTRIAAIAPELMPAVTLPDAVVLRVASGRSSFAALHDAIPPTASIFLSSAVQDDATYLDRALVAHVLRDRHIRGVLETGWASEPAPPNANEPFDYGIFGAAEPVSDAFDTHAPMWTDGVLVAYRARAR